MRTSNCLSHGMGTSQTIQPNYWKKTKEKIKKYCFGLDFLCVVWLGVLCVVWCEWLVGDIQTSFACYGDHPKPTLAQNPIVGVVCLSLFWMPCKKWGNKEPNIQEWYWFTCSQCKSLSPCMLVHKTIFIYGETQRHECVLLQNAHRVWPSQVSIE